MRFNVPAMPLSLLLLVLDTCVALQQPMCRLVRNQLANPNADSSSNPPSGGGSSTATSNPATSSLVAFDYNKEVIRGVNL